MLLNEQIIKKIRWEIYKRLMDIKTHLQKNVQPGNIQ